MVLAKRLIVIMEFIVSKQQPAFINDKYLVNGAMIVNEVDDLVKRTKNGCVIFKVDFKKGYYSISWKF